MPYPLNNVATGNAYTEALTLRLTPARKSITLVISTAAIYYSKAEAIMLVHPGAEQFQAEVFAAPGRLFFDENDMLPGSLGFVALQLRSAVANTPALVSAS